MTKFNQQFQNDISGAANGMITQMLCAERGIDYNNLMQVAQQNHMQGILQMEQQRQMQTLVKRHYSGDTFFGKIATAFGGQETNLLMPVPAPTFGQQPMMQPQLQQQAFAPPAMNSQNPAETAQYLANQQQFQPQITAPAPIQEDEVATLRNEMAQIKSLLANLSQPVMHPGYSQSGHVPEYGSSEPTT